MLSNNTKRLRPVGGWNVVLAVKVGFPGSHTAVLGRCLQPKLRSAIYFQVC